MMTEDQDRIMWSAINLVNQWRAGLRNNQCFELDLWKAVDVFQDKNTANEKWLREEE